MITINQNVIADIKAEAEEFGFPTTAESIARDYFTRMSYDEKAALFDMVPAQKGVTAFSRACVAKVAELIAA